MTEAINLVSNNGEIIWVSAYLLQSPVKHI